MTKQHQPVLLREAINSLQVVENRWYIDATFGRGGHTQALLENKARVIALDCDQEAILYGQQHFQDEIEQNRLILIRDNFEHLEKHIKHLKTSSLINQIQGILFDFGSSVDQLKSDKRGFSFANPQSALDMRMDDRLGVTAADLLKVLSIKQLTHIFAEFGGESQSRQIAKRVVRARKGGENFATVESLLNLIKQVKPRKQGRLHPATKVFQALRIAVNSELESIHSVLPSALALLGTKGRIVTISFHEGEDRIVKQFFKKWEQQGLGQQITKKPIRPSSQEINNNPRSRSAKLRIFEK